MLDVCSLQFWIFVFCGLLAPIFCGCDKRADSLSTSVSDQFAALLQQQKPAFARVVRSSVNVTGTSGLDFTATGEAEFETIGALVQRPAVDGNFSAEDNRLAKELNVTVKALTNAVWQAYTDIGEPRLIVLPSGYRYSVKYNLDGRRSGDSVAFSMVQLSAPLDQKIIVLANVSELQAPSHRIFASRTEYNSKLLEARAARLEEFKRDLSARKAVLGEWLKHNRVLVGNCHQHGTPPNDYRVELALSWDPSTQRVSGTIGWMELQARKQVEGEIVLNFELVPQLKLVESKLLTQASNKTLFPIKYELTFKDRSLAGDWRYTKGYVGGAMILAAP